MAATSASTQSVQKASSACVNVSTDKNSQQQRRRSCDTVCSSNSSCFLRKRKPVHPLATAVRTYGAKPSGNVVKQRVMSAKLLKLRSIQSELNDANFHLVELAKENRALKALQRRQDKALSNYEGVNAELPKLIKSHEEEIRVLQEKNKVLKKQLKEVNEQLKFKDEELHHVKEQLKRLIVLSKDKHLPEREKLAEQVEELKESLTKSETKMSMLNRQLMLEQKNAKYKVNNESQKCKQIQKDLSQALAEIDRLNTLLDARGKFISVNCRKRFPNTHSVSLVALGTTKSAPNAFHSRTESNSLTDVKEEPSSLKVSSGNSMTDLKLEPIITNISSNAKEDLESPPATNGMLTSPLENVKARLSANLKKYSADVDDSKSKLGTLNLSETDLLGLQESKNMFTTPTQITHKSRPNSSQKLEKLSDTIQKVVSKTDVELGETLGAYANQIVNSVRTSNMVVSKHNETLESAKTATDDILSKLKETDMVDKKLRTNKVINKDDFEIPERDLDLVNQIWKDEYSFQKNANKNAKTIKKYDFLSKSTDKNGNTVDEPDVPLENKQKLLETLRAIDNGDNVDSEKEVPAEHKRKLLATLRAIDSGETVDASDNDSRNSNNRRYNIMKELFG